MTELAVGVIDVFLVDPRDGFRVLVLRRGEGTRCTGAWEVVHGRVEGQERPEDAAEREVGEETGLRVERLYNVICQPFYLHRLSTVHIAVVFAAFVDSRARVTLSAEHDRSEWLPVEQALARLTWPRSRRALEDLFSMLWSGDAGPAEDVLRVR